MLLKNANDENGVELREKTISVLTRDVPKLHLREKNHVDLGGLMSVSLHSKYIRIRHVPLLYKSEGCMESGTASKEPAYSNLHQTKIEHTGMYRYNASNSNNEEQSTTKKCGRLRYRNYYCTLLGSTGLPRD